VAASSALTSADGAVIPLSHGRTLVVRSATGDDADRLAALYAGLDTEDAYRRFFSVFRPDHAFMERMATAAERGGDELLALVSSGDGTEDLVIAEAGWTPLADGDGELSMVIATGWRGWLGPYLLDLLLRRAAAKGVANLCADVLAVNGPMLALLASRGAARVDQNDWSVVRLRIGTSGTTPTWRASRGKPRLLVEVPGATWHAGAAARRAGFEVLACGGPRGSPTRCPALRGEPCPLVAGADVVVVSHPHDDEDWRALAIAHRSLHPDATIVDDDIGGGDEIVERLVERVAGRSARPPEAALCAR
jgi:hypothetical protein